MGANAIAFTFKHKCLPFYSSVLTTLVPALAGSVTRCDRFGMLPKQEIQVPLRRANAKITVPGPACSWDILADHPSPRRNPGHR